MKSFEQMTSTLRFKVIYKRNFTVSMVMYFLSHALLRGSDEYEEHGDVFFCSMPLYILDVCPENQDESNGNSIIKMQ